MQDIVSARLLKRSSRSIGEFVIELLLLLCASVSILATVSIVWILVADAVPFFEAVGIKRFLTEKMWTPMFEDAKYGILPLVSGTFTTSLVAVSIAIPFGTIIAIYLSEFAGYKTREIVKPFLELLGSVPSIVYGYFALTCITPVLQKIFPELPGFNMLSAGIMMGIAIIPYISSLAEDAMRAVPMSLREGAYGMGSTKFQTSINIVYPAAISGILSAYILGIARAIGETMIVSVAAGMQPTLSFNPMTETQTISAYIVQVALGDAPHGSIGYQSIFAAGLVLLIFTLIFNILGHCVRSYYKKQY